MSSELTKATIKDVARVAGVSTATVSHVINQSRGLRKETKLKVWAAVEGLCYTPNVEARNLAKMRRSKLAGSR